MPNRRFATGLASALADLGVEHACVSPGSRNTPLIAGFSAEPRIKMWPLLDERAAAFFALGLAKATGRAVVLACTSGTAAVEYHPAVVEASQSDVPLIVLTADRPEELRGIGAPQTIDQLSLYGTAVRMFADCIAPDADTDSAVPGEIAIDAWAHAHASPPGPVHLNLPFREPLLDATPVGSIPQVELPPDLDLDAPTIDEIALRLNGRRGMIIAGRSNDPGLPDACTSLAHAAGFPILADPLSGLRFGEHSTTNVLAHGDLMAATGQLDDSSPEVILRIGPVPTSKSTWEWMAANSSIDQILIDEQSRDATHSAALVLEIPPAEALHSLAAALKTPAPSGWLAEWLSRDHETGRRLAANLESASFPTEPQIARTVLESAPPGSILTVGSSMPVRDVDTYGGKGSKPLRIFGNRGANGIDGVLAAALGSAAEGSNAIALLGDVSLFHDMNSLGTAAQLGLPMTVVVVNNNGGGIFSFLPQSNRELLDSDVFERYLATPHGTSFVAVAAALGLETHTVADSGQLAEIVAVVPDRPRLIEITTSRSDNRDTHRSILRSVADGLK